MATGYHGNLQMVSDWRGNSLMVIGYYRYGNIQMVIHCRGNSQIARDCRGGLPLVTKSRGE